MVMIGERLTLAWMDCTSMHHDDVHRIQIPHPTPNSTMEAAQGPDPSILSSKRVVYVGGLHPNANPQMLRAAFIPFGPIQSVEMVRSVPCVAEFVGFLL